MDKSKNNKVDEPLTMYNVSGQEITEFSQLDLDQSYTYAQYLTWKFSERVELIKGKVFKFFSASRRYHQDILGALYVSMAPYFKNRSCRIYLAPFDVRFPKDANDTNPNTVVQPDICMVCDLSKLDDRGCCGAPDLIIEILSSSTSAKDTRDKFDLYEKHGVKEYWIVDPSNKILDIFELKEGKYHLRGKFNENDIVKVGLFPDLQVVLSEVFEDIPG